MTCVYSSDERAGLLHIVSRHADDFAQVSISEAQISDVFSEATTRVHVVGIHSSGRPIFQVAFGRARSSWSEILRHHQRDWHILYPFWKNTGHGQPD